MSATGRSKLPEPEVVPRPSISLLSELYKRPGFLKEFRKLMKIERKKYGVKTK